MAIRPAEAFLFFSIGPVQDFIAAARRAQDLWMGSQLLSRLIGVALDAIVGEPNTNMLYPIRLAAVDQGSLPNKLVALLPADEAEGIAQQVEEAVRTKWQEIARAVSEYLSELQPADATWRNIWDGQVKGFPDVYWSIYSWPEQPRQDYKDLLGQAPGEDKADYSLVYTLGERAFETRKVVRDFSPTEEEGPKCTMCGQRSALHRSEKRPHEYWRALSKTKGVTAAELRPEGRERLCAVCAIKRFAQRACFVERPRFPSTSSIAAASFKLRLLQTMQARDFPLALFEALHQHQGILRKLDLFQVSEEVIPFLKGEFTAVEGAWRDRAAILLRYDGDTLFPETFTPKRLEDDYGVSVSEGQAEEVRQRTAALLAAARDAEIPLPSKYYALLMMDGDRMGGLLSRVESKEEHEEISETLATFAGKVARYILEEKRPGRVVYAGGDDLLALLPLADTLEAARELRLAFAEALPGRTTSAGMAIAHHLYPLDAALGAMRQAERAAKDKNRYDRNALAVHLLRRAGERMVMGAHWDYDCDDDKIDTIELIADVRRHFSDGRLSMRFATILYDEARTLALKRFNEIKGQWEEVLSREALQAELGRLLLRQAGAHLSKEAREKQADDLARRLSALAAALDEDRTDPERGPAPGVVELSRWLLLARFLAQEGGR